MEPARIDRPIFIVGPHRSGTTILYNILGRHEQTGYLNEFTEHHPSWSFWAAFGRRFGVNDLPREGQRLWDRWKPRPDDVRGAEHATPTVAAWYRDLVSRTLHHRGATRFLAKYPRLSLRMPWLEEVFPGALYVHMLRDWRGVVSSTVQRHLKRVGRRESWFGVRPPDWEGWRHRDPAEISTHQFISAQRAVLAEAERLGERYIPLRYRDLCAEPEQTMRRLLRQLGLPWSERFSRVIRAAALKSCDDKWMVSLGVERVAQLRLADPEFLMNFEEGARIIPGSSARSETMSVAT